MPKAEESRVLKACEAARAVKKPNLAAISRQFGVSYNVLRQRIRQGRGSCSDRIPNNRALEAAQEEALRYWILHMRDLHMPITPGIVEAWANSALQRAGNSTRKVSKMWAGRFLNRLRPELRLASVQKKCKESKCFAAEDAGDLSQWYTNLEKVTRDLRPCQLYNFDECGFQSGQEIHQMVISGSYSTPSLPS